jgi:glycosyltransferase involved in cell wall biosynthesis
MKRFDSSTGQARVTQTGRKVVSKGDKQVGTSSSFSTDPSTHRAELRNRLVSVEDYEPFIGPEVVDRILRKAKALQAFRVLNFNSTFYGGGVGELLSGMTLLMNSLGIKAEWRVIQGRPDFFNITKKMHNALQGADINLSEIKTSIFEEVNFENAVRNRIDHDIVLAMWKGTPVIGGNVGGIRSQIQDGVNGFLVSSIEEAARRIVQLLKDARLREHMGRKARQTVAERFLLTRYLEQYLGLFGSFETVFRLRDSWHAEA